MVSSSTNTASDPRYTLTEEEADEVRALKERCDSEGIKYNSIFELAKYCFVSSSISDKTKRQNDSFQRIKKNRAFEKKLKLDEIDLFEALKEVQEKLPNFSLACGKVNDKWCVGFTSRSADPDYMMKNKALLYKVEFSRFDLAASDLEEARKGFYIVGTTKDLKANPLRSVRAALKFKPLLGGMTANRIRGIYYASSRSVVLVSNIFLSLVSKRVRDRVNLVSSLKKSKLWKEHDEEFRKNIHVKLGGEYEKSLIDWIKERLVERQKTDSLVSLS